MTQDLPSPPFVEVPGVANFRGVGGTHVGPGLVFRSADPNKATSDGLTKMGKDLGIRMVYDFRSAPEINRDGPEYQGMAVDSTDVWAPYGIKREWVPCFAEKDYGPEQIALRYKEYTREGTEGFVQAYRDILNAAPAAYAKVFRHLAEDKPTPCLVHCTAGKDRTGVIVALLLLLVGTPDDEISEEYALTDLGLAALKPVFQERLLKNPALAGNVEGVKNMTSSKKENMDASIKMINNEFGGPKGYMTKYCGLSEDEIEKIRKNLSEGALSNL